VTNEHLQQQFKSLSSENQKLRNLLQEAVDGMPETRIGWWAMDAKSVLADESATYTVAKLKDLLSSVPPCQACLGNPMVASCPEWCRVATAIRNERERHDNYT